MLLHVNVNVESTFAILTTEQILNVQLAYNGMDFWWAMFGKVCVIP